MYFKSCCDLLDCGSPGKHSVRHKRLIMFRVSRNTENSAKVTSIQADYTVVIYDDGINGYLNAGRLGKLVMHESPRRLLMQNLLPLWIWVFSKVMNAPVEIWRHKSRSTGPNRGYLACKPSPFAMDPKRDE